jgi:3'-5' exoribonuclease
MTKQMISELTPDAPVSSCFAVLESELRPMSGKGGSYLHIIFGDSSGTITARMWENATENAAICSLGSAVAVAGLTTLYQDELQVKVVSLRRALSGEYRESELRPLRWQDPDSQRLALLAELDEIRQTHLRDLLGSFFDQDGGFLESFMLAPAAVRIHHAYPGGLIDHTMAVVRLLKTTMQEHPGLDRDLLVAGGLLHDLGKVETYLPQKLAYRVSDEGRLLDHVVLGERMVTARLAEIPAFPRELSLHLLHLILSHHGSKEFGSPIQPMTPEAIALHHCDYLDAQVQRFQETVRQCPPGQRWTAYQPSLGHSLFIPQPSLD